MICIGQEGATLEAKTTGREDCSRIHVISLPIYTSKDEKLLVSQRDYSIVNAAGLLQIFETDVLPSSHFESVESSESLHFWHLAI